MSVPKILEEEDFKFLSGDINYLDYGCTWYKNEEDEITLIELINNQDVGLTSDKTYTVLVKFMYLDLTDSDLKPALNCCGYIKTRDNIEYFNNRSYTFKLEELEDLIDFDKSILETVIDSYNSYGAYDTKAELSGDNFDDLLDEALNIIYQPIMIYKNQHKETVKVEQIW